MRESERQEENKIESSNLMDSWRNTIQLTDCVAAMSRLGPCSADLIIADPPYNLSKGGHWSWDNSVDLPGFGGKWKKTAENWDSMSFEAYYRFTESWIAQAKRILKPSGSIWVYGTYHNLGVVNVIFQRLGIEIINEIIWYKRNSFPNLSGRRFTASHESILWAHVGGRKRGYYFNYKAMKNSNFPEDSLKKTGKQMRTVWDIPNNKNDAERRFGTHPTQKPIRLCQRMITATSRPGDLVLVPFAGTGSECVAAKLLGRDFIGFEIEPKYYEIAGARLLDAQSEVEQLSFGLESFSPNEAGDKRVGDTSPQKLQAKLIGN
jgi:site-specific DNA-methyltransferase (adenine-specific)